MAHVDVSDKHWPAVVTTVPSGDIADEDMHQANRDFLEIIKARRAEYVTVTDLRSGGRVTPKQRAIITNFMADHDYILGRYCVGAAMIFDSAVMRGMLTAILWLRTPEYPTKVFATSEEAIEWGRLRAEGMAAAERKHG